MRRSQTQRLGDLLKDYTRTQHLDGKLKELEIIEHCHEILGRTMGRYVRRITMKNGELTIEVSSSIVKSELIMLREELRSQINEKAGASLVSRIILK
ncbi:MAG: DUF721 domain-containing protein [Bacteroidota bacterium]